MMTELNSGRNLFFPPESSKLFFSRLKRDPKSQLFNEQADAETMVLNDYPVLMLKYFCGVFLDQY